MELSAVIATLRAHEAEFRWLGVQRLFSFGATARDEAGSDSDVDLFFDDPRGEFGLYELMDVKEAAARILGRDTDVMTRDSIHKALRARIETEAVPVF
jgi:predicted nucleotidyltransferase